MLNKLVETSLQYKLLVILAFVVVGFLGWRAVSTVPIHAFPDITPVQVNIYTESLGFAAEDVEKLPIFPIESGMAWLPTCRSSARSAYLDYLTSRCTSRITWTATSVGGYSWSGAGSKQQHPARL